MSCDAYTRGRRPCRNLGKFLIEYTMPHRAWTEVFVCTPHATQLGRDWMIDGLRLLGRAPDPRSHPVTAVQNVKWLAKFGRDENGRMEERA